MTLASSFHAERAEVTRGILNSRVISASFNGENAASAEYAFLLSFSGGRRLPANPPRTRGRRTEMKQIC